MDPQQSMPSMSLPPLNGATAADDSGGVVSGVDNTQHTPSNSQISRVVAPSQEPMSRPNPVNGPVVSMPNIADDVDLIEKEWVVKIREVINATAADPYERARQLTLLKNDYLQKRYQRAIEPS